MFMTGHLIYLLAKYRPGRIIKRPQSIAPAIMITYASWFKTGYISRGSYDIPAGFIQICSQICLCPYVRYPHPESHLYIADHLIGKFGILVWDESLLQGEQMQWPSGRASTNAGSICAIFGLSNQFHCRWVGSYPEQQ